MASICSEGVVNMVSDDRIRHLISFYSILDALEKNIGGARKLGDCSGRTPWPQRGIYFFRELGEQRVDSGNGPRIVRVGTHALREGGSTRLWTRLSQHKGQTSTGGGNYRGSIFRLLVGSSLIRRQSYCYPTWGDKHSAARDIRANELPLEREVSGVIGNMPFLWLAIDDEAGPESLRGYIEKNAIALLSNYKRHPLDPASQGWLGHDCDRERVRASGIWNSNHVEESYDPAFLDILGRLSSEAGTTA
jgi:hypothetical protein